MGSLIYLPPNTAGGKVQDMRLDFGGVTLTFEPGVPKHVPVELFAAAQVALRALGANLVSPAPAIATTGGAAGTQSYQVVAFNANGDTLPSSTTTTNTGPTTLDATHYNTLTWASAAGATGFKVIRTAGGPSPGIIATLSAAQLSFVDNGVAASVYTPAGAAVSQVGVVNGPSEI